MMRRLSAAVVLAVILAMIPVSAFAANHEHEWDMTDVAQRPSCTEGAWYELTCKICGKVKRVETEPATGHSWGKWKEEKADCDHAGSRTRKCKVCGAKETEEIARLYHKFSEPYEMPTEEKPALVRRCSLCGLILYEGEYARCREESAGAAAIQQLLKDEGYLRGSVDGVFGSKTEQAVRAYQKDRELDRSGIARRDTVQALLGELLDRSALPASPEEPLAVLEETELSAYPVPGEISCTDNGDGTHTASAPLLAIRFCFGDLTEEIALVTAFSGSEYTWTEEHGPDCELCPPQLPAAGEEEPAEYYTVAASAVTVREGCGLKYARLGTLSGGEVFAATGIAREGGEPWLSLDFGGSEGWVMMEYCTPLEGAPEPEQAAEDPDALYLVVSRNGVPLYGDTSEEAEVLLSLSRGDRLKVLDYREGWYRVGTGGTEGWTDPSYVKAERAPAVTVNVNDGSSPFMTLESVWSEEDNAWIYDDRVRPAAQREGWLCTGWTLISGRWEPLRQEEYRIFTDCVIRLNWKKR